MNSMIQSFIDIMTLHGSHRKYLQQCILDLVNTGGVLRQGLLLREAGACGIPVHS